MQTAHNLPFTFVLKHLKSSHNVTVDSSSSSLLHLVQSLNLDIDLSHAKLIVQGDAGIKPNSKVTILASSTETIRGLEAAQKRAEARQLVPRLPSAKLRSTGIPSPYGFDNFQSHPGMPQPKDSLDQLKFLANDPAIKHLMQSHKWRVPLLAELSPIESPDLLGLNRNKGGEIHLRLRTDDLQGFRLYSDVRRVLLHELSHNVFGDHDENFKELNSQLNREVASFEYSSNTIGNKDMYRPPNDLSDIQASHNQGQRLGGSTASLSNILSKDQVRQIREQSAVDRASAQEKEIEDGCSHVT